MLKHALIALVVGGNGLSHAEMFRCRSLITDMVYEANTPCSQAIEINRTNRWGAWMLSPSEEKLKFSLTSGAVSGDQIEKAIKIGMSAKDVVAAIGVPKDINISISRWGKRQEQWVYPGGGTFRNHYVYIDGGFVDFIQITK